jgi:hypothetical protein
MGDELLYLLGGIGVVMLIICLVVREGTEGRLARKRTELMSLRNAERGLESKINGLQTVKAQLRESVGRAEGRSISEKQLLESIYEKLERLYEHLRNESCPKPPELAVPTEEEEAS